MPLNTAQLRRAWAPKATPKGDIFIPAYQALDQTLRRWHFDGGRGDTGAYNDRPITGGTGPSLHAFGPGDRFTFWFGVTVVTALAVDIDWTNNPYGPALHTNMPGGMVAEAKAWRTNTGAQLWGWGGNYRGNKDPMHFEIVCAPNDLRSGIRSLNLGPPPAPPAGDLAQLRMAINFAKLGFHDIGATGEDVHRDGRAAAIRIAQTLLNRWADQFAAMAGQPNPRDIAVTGEFDQPTRDAVIAVQRILRIPELGTIGLGTWDAIDR